MGYFREVLHGQLRGHWRPWKETALGGADELVPVVALDGAVILAAGTATIGKVGIDQTTPGTTNGVVVSGDVAHDAADSGAPVKIGGRAYNTLPSVSAGNRVNAAFDTNGCQFVRIYRLEKQEDVAHTSGDAGLMALAVSAATPTATAGTAGDYQPLCVSSVDGAVYVKQANTPVAVSCSVPDDAGGLSAEVDLGPGRVLCGLQMPADWTAAGLTFQASYTTGGTFYNLYDDSGTEISKTVADDRFVAFTDVTPFLGVRYIKVRSGTSGAPVQQAAARTLQLMTRPA